MLQQNSAFLTVFIFPTIVSTLCAAIAFISLLRLPKVKYRKEIFQVVLICIAAGLWAFNELWYGVSWRMGKGIALLLMSTTLQYAYFILVSPLVSALRKLLYGTTLALIVLLVLPGIAEKTYSVIFFCAVYPQVIAVNISLFRRFFALRIKFYLIAAIMAGCMIGFGMFETINSQIHRFSFPGPLLGAAAYVIAAWMLIIERGYFNTKTWTDYMVAINEKEQLLKQQNLTLIKSYTNAISVLTQTIEAKDPYTRGHCLRVRNYSKAIGEALDFSDASLQFLEYGAVLHDIGKILIPGRILNKNGSLDEAEFATVKKHPQIGADILQNVEDFVPIIPMIRHHHEYIDGNGYPDGLKGDAIPLQARILAVADTYDALTSTRPYRQALDRTDALAILEKTAGTQLDAQIVRIFIDRKIYGIPQANIELLFPSFHAD